MSAVKDGHVTVMGQSSKACLGLVAGAELQTVIAGHIVFALLVPDCAHSSHLFFLFG